MRRVVVTGLGMVSPLGCGVEATWQRLARRRERRRARSTSFEISDLACQIACQIPRGDGSDGTFNPDQWMEPKEQRKVDHFIVYAMAAATQALRRRRLEAARRRRGPERDRRPHRLRHRRHRRHRRRLDHAVREGPAAHLAVLHPGPPHQPRLRLRLDRARAQGPEPRRRHRLLDRRARDRRRGAADRARRRRRHGGRRRRIADQPPLARRLRRLPGALDRLQRRADARLAPLRPGPRRLRHGRGRRRRRARGATSTPRRAARRSTPR